MSSRRLLLVAPSAYPLGGVAIWLNYLLPGLARKGWHPVLGLTQGHWHDVQKYRLAMPQGEVIAIANPTGSHEGRLRALAGAIGDVAPALVAGVNIADCYAAVARLRATGRPAPRAVMTIHGIQPDLYEDVHLFRSVLDGVICSNRLACHLAGAQGNDARRVHYAPYGVELPLMAAPASRHGGAPLRLAFVGRLEEWQKRLSDLAAVVAKLETRGVNFELLVAGAGPDEALLAEALEPLRSRGRARMLGSLTPAQVADQVYSHADALLLTSMWETGPLVVWEAMAHGLAVVSSRYVGSGAEAGLRDSENCLLFPVGDIDAAADCIARLQDAGLRARLAGAARALVQSRYSRPRSVDAWSAALDAVLASPPLSGASDGPRVEQAGRLDAWLGTARAETLRRAVRLRFRHRDPGGEWPHSYGHRAIDDASFWQEASALDTVSP